MRKSLKSRRRMMSKDDVDGVVFGSGVLEAASVCSGHNVPYDSFALAAADGDAQCATACAVVQKRIVRFQM